MIDKRKKIPPLLIRPELRRMFAKLTNADVGLVLRSLMDYRFDGVVPSLPDRLDGIFMALRAFADDDADRYEETRESNRRAARIRWDQQNANNASESE